MNVPTKRVLVVGLGYAGSRLLAALRHLGPACDAEVVGAVDLDRGKLELLRREGLFVSTSLEQALESLDPEIVVATVNEEAHVSVLQRIAMSGARALLCEKPLAPTLTESVKLKGALRQCAFSMNMVERFSDAVAEADAWLRDIGPFEPLRVEFQWGKHRIGDRRPTIGVTSEIIHPLDLVRLLFGLESLSDVVGCATSSVLRPDHIAALDWVSLAGFADAGFPVVGAASFSWPRRVRTVTALISDAAGSVYRMMLHFDTPHWDCDGLLVEKIDRASGRYETIHTFATSLEDIPEPLRGINKVARFVEESLAGWSGGVPTVELVDVAEAIALQRLVDMACKPLVRLETGDSLLGAGRSAVREAEAS